MRSSSLQALLVSLGILMAASSCKKETRIFEGHEIYEDSSDFLSHSQTSAQHAVEDYKVLLEYRTLNAPISKDLLGNNISFSNGDVVRIIRKLSFAGKPAYVVMHARNFEVALLDSVDFDAKSAAANEETQHQTAISLKLAKHRHTALSSLEALGDAGQQKSGQTRFAVTIDMCQSSRKWNKEVFEALVNEQSRLGKPIKVGVAMTGLWMNGHQEEWRELRSWRAEHKLDIVWINHSYHHQLSKQKNGEYLFLTADTIDFRNEVLLLEKALLAQGEIFSPLFRFPGLVHNKKRLEELNDLSLFALDANAWLAKGEHIHDKSVVLVHGNGNEPVGIRMFLEELSERKEKLASGLQRIFSPLSTVSEEELN